MSPRSSGPPARWEPDGHERVVAGLTKNGQHAPQVAELAAEYALLQRPLVGDPTAETWIVASQTARFCAESNPTGVRPSRRRRRLPGDAYNALAAALADWFELFDDRSPRILSEAGAILAAGSPA